MIFKELLQKIVSFIIREVWNIIELFIQTFILT